MSFDLNTDLARRAEAYLGGALDLEDFRVLSAEPVSGAGLSRRVIKLVTTSAKTPEEVAYILLLEQVGSPVEKNAAAEFAILRALSTNPRIKVAAAHWMEPDPKFLGAPFLLTGFLPGIARPQMLLTPDFLPSGSHLITASFATLGRLAALDIASLDLDTSTPVPDIHDVWRIELDRWETALREADAESCIVTKAALRRLHRERPPSPVKLSIVHGDYRVGNYLFDHDGLTGVIDWEMVHCGDAVEDLAWSLMPNWEFSHLPGRVGGFLSREEAVAAWEATSGMGVDAVSLAWWTLLCHVKAVAIWATARHLVNSEKDRTPLMALVGYGLVEKQEVALADLLHRTPQ